MVVIVVVIVVVTVANGTMVVDVDPVVVVTEMVVAHLTRKLMTVFCLTSGHP